MAGQADLSTCVQATSIQVTVFSLVLGCIHTSGLMSIIVCVHTTVHGTCHVLSVHLSSMCSFNTQLVYITIDEKNTFSTLPLVAR